MRVVGIWSHFACADIPGHPSIDAQLAAFRDAVALAERPAPGPRCGTWRTRPATLTLPQA